MKWSTSLSHPSPSCVVSRPLPGRQPVVVSTVWHWLWTPAELPLAWHCFPLVPPAQPPSVLSWRGCRNTGKYIKTDHHNNGISAHILMLRVWAVLCFLKSRCECEDILLLIKGTPGPLRALCSINPFTNPYIHPPRRVCCSTERWLKLQRALKLEVGVSWPVSVKAPVCHMSCNLAGT